MNRDWTRASQQLSSPWSRPSLASRTIEGWRRRLAYSPTCRSAEEDASPTHGDRDAGDRSDEMIRLEAVLFLAKEPLGVRRLAMLADLDDGSNVRELLQRLQTLYDEAHCAFRIVEVAGGFQLLSRPQFAPWLRRLHAEPVEVRLSPAAMETLTIIAYRQPVLRATVEAIRGVQCGEILRQLMDRDLVRIAGRAEELGRPFLYGTTRQFLQVFGLGKIDDLPSRETMWETVVEVESEAPDAAEEPPSEAA